MLWRTCQMLIYVISTTDAHAKSRHPGITICNHILPTTQQRPACRSRPRCRESAAPQPSAGAQHGAAHAPGGCASRLRHERCDAGPGAMTVSAAGEVQHRGAPRSARGTAAPPSAQSTATGASPEPPAASPTAYYTPTGPPRSGLLGWRRAAARHLHGQQRPCTRLQEHTSGRLIGGRARRQSVTTQSEALKKPLKWPLQSWPALERQQQENRACRSARSRGRGS